MKYIVKKRVQVPINIDEVTLLFLKHYSGTMETFYGSILEGGMIRIERPQYPEFSVILKPEWVCEVKEEPIVFGFDEWWCNNNDSRGFACGYDEAKKIADVFDKNGQLKQWKNHHEFREAIKEYIIRCAGKISMDIEYRLQNAFKNLKPLD